MRVLLIGMLMCMPSLAVATTASLVSADRALLLDPLLELNVETGSVLTLEQARAAVFKPVEQSIVNRGFNPAPVWYRVELHNALSADSGMNAWVLDFGYPLLDAIDVHVIRANGVVETILTGDRRPVAAGQMDHRKSVLSLRLDPGETVQLYLRVQTESTHLLNLSVEPPSVFVVKTGLENLWFGMYFGLMFGLATYNFFILLSVRDVSYVYHVMYILSMAALQLDLHGFSRQYLWAGPGWPNVSMPGTVAGAILFSVLFTRSMLQTQKHSRPLHLMLNVGLALTGVCFVLAFFAPYSVSMPFNTLASALVVMMLVTAGVGMLRKGVRAARLYLVAWSVYLVGIILRALEGTGVIAPTLLSEYGTPIGSATVVTLLSLALADRINTEREQRARALAATAAKSEFLAKMSHELRTPMNAIIGFTQLALRGNNESQRTGFLRHIETASRSLLHLINDILDLSKIEAGKLTLEKTRFEIAPVLTKIGHLFSGQAETRGLQLHVQMPPSPVEVVGDSLRLEQVLVNLVGNALKFTEDGSVEVSVEEAARDLLHIILRFNVRDTGIGISAEQRERLFAPFSQADSSTTRRYGGSGLGLAISRQLVELMHGEMGVDSELGKGSYFWFTARFEVPAKEEKTV